MIKGLLIETSSENCSVGISLNGHLIYCMENSKEFRHAELLHVFIQRCLEECDLKLNDLEYIGIGTGPGSYTGLRIGYSAAKAMAYALHIPLVGMYSSQSVYMTAIAQNLKVDKTYVMLDAGRMEVYLSEHDANGNLIQEPAPFILNENFISMLQADEKILLAGSGVNKILQHTQHLKNIYTQPHILPSVQGMDKILFEKYQNNDTLDVFSCEPDYLKEYQLKTKKTA
jgi:tRNA threonylcarbamoyladenosine biosynthesis protein TsaB